MLTIKNGSSFLKDGTLSKTKAPYYIAGVCFNLCDMSPEIADEIIGMFDAGEFSAYENLNIQQYDFYRDVSEFQAGLEKLFFYFIFMNQWFIENHVSIVVFRDEFEKATSEQILSSQKKITKTSEVWPPNTQQFYGKTNLSDRVVSNVNLSIVSGGPYESLILDSQQTDSYVETVDETDSTKDKTGATGKEEYHHYTYIQHDIVTASTTKNVSNIYGSLTSNLRLNGGAIVFDIWKVVKEEDQWISTGGESE